MIEATAKDTDRLKLSYGLGVDSTAILVGWQKRGIRPRIITFADTGAEKPGTYAFLPVINEWLRDVGFPEVTVVKYQPVRAPYDTLEGNCLSNETLPSLAFGFKSCSIKFKREPQEKYVKKLDWVQELWADGGRILNAIGYDARETHRSAAKGNEQWEYTYPLRVWGWDREECKRQIAAAGLPVPPKSACFFCPATKKPELVQLAADHPDLIDRAIAIEQNARDGKHGLKTVKGLGRNFSWEDYLGGPKCEKQQMQLFT